MKFKLFAFLGMFVLLLVACIKETPTEPYPAPESLGENLRLPRVVGMEFLCKSYQATPEILQRTPVIRVLCDLFEETPTVPPRPSDTPTSTIVPPTDTPTSTVVPPSPTSTNTPTEPIPTDTPTSTPTEPPVGIHDTSFCHLGGADNFYHAHGTCYDQLPESSIKAFIGERMWLYNLNNGIRSSPLENVFPHPNGKHEGFMFGYFDLSTNLCLQFTGAGTPPNADCLKSMWFRLHSMGIAHEARAALSEHSDIIVAEVCSRNPDGTTMSDNCNVILVSGKIGYGEVHSQYKETGCPGIPDGIYFPAPYSVGDGDGDDALPPYVAGHGNFASLTNPTKMFWNSQTVQVVVNQNPALFDINNLFEVAWTETSFGKPNTDPNLCANEEFDLIQFESTNDPGMKRIIVFWTFDVDVTDLPRPTDEDGNFLDFEGFVDGRGNYAPACTQINDNCFPFFFPGDLPNRRVFFNLPVRNASNFANPPLTGSPNAVPVDLTVPDWYAPGFAP